MYTSEGVFKQDEVRSERPFIFDFLKRNECGYMPMPWQGKVRNIVPMRDAMIVLGDGGVSAVYNVQEPYPTLGLVNEIANLPRGIAIANSGAVDGNEDVVLFVASDGTLWAIDSKLQAEELGYKEFFDDMLGGTIKVVYSQADRCFYIGDGTDTYRFTRNGLAKIDQVITSAGFWSGGEVGYSGAAGGSDNDFLLTTDVTDLGYRGLKHITSIEIDAETDNAEPIYASVYWRKDKNGSFSQTGWRLFNDVGWVRLPVSGVDFKIALKCTNYANVIPPNKITITYNSVDKRNIRGQRG